MTTATESSKHRAANVHRGSTDALNNNDLDVAVQAFLAANRPAGPAPASAGPGGR